MLYQAIKEGHPECPKTDRIYISVGNLIDAMDQVPQAHVSYEERLHWMKTHDNLPKYRGKTKETVAD